MKVLFVQNIEGIAGSEKYFWQLLPALKSKGIDVEFLCIHQKKFNEVVNQFAKELLDHQIKVHFIETSSYVHPKVFFKMHRLIKKEKYDIIHSHLIYADFWSAILKSFFRIKQITVSTLHGYQEDVYTKYCLEPKKIPKNKYYKIARFTYKKIDFIYACSHGLKNFFEQIDIKTKKPITVIHHGFDYPSINKTQVNKQDFNCVIVGRLIPRKGHAFVLNQCHLIKQNVPNFKLTIVGDGELFDTFKRQIERENLTDFVFLTGYTHTPRVEMEKANLVLVPSYAEGLPLVIFEAMSLSKPVIAFNTIGPAETIVEGKTGCLITPFNELEFAQKIIKISEDETLLESMGFEAKKLVDEKFSLKNMRDETIQFYQTCLNSRPFLTT